MNTGNTLHIFIGYTQRISNKNNTVMYWQRYSRGTDSHPYCHACV